MDLLGIGPLELAFIVLIALIVLGPKDMVKAGKTIGRVLRTIVTSDNWRTIQQASKEVRDLPNKLMREAGLEEIQNQLPKAKAIGSELGLDDLNNLNRETQDELTDWTTPPADETPQVEALIEETSLTESPASDAVEKSSAEALPEDISPEGQISDENGETNLDVSDIGSIQPPDIENKTDATDTP